MRGAGNVTSREAGSMMENIEGILKSGPLVDVKAPCLSQLSERRITCLEPGIEWFYPVAGMNPDDENSATGIYFQV
jgi:insulysin